MLDSIRIDMYLLLDPTTQLKLRYQRLPTVTHGYQRLPTVTNGWDWPLARGYFNAGEATSSIFYLNSHGGFPHIPIVKEKYIAVTSERDYVSLDTNGKRLDAEPISVLCKCFYTLKFMRFRSTNGGTRFDVECKSIKIVSFPSVRGSIEIGRWQKLPNKV